MEQLHLLRSINTKLTDETDLRDYGNSGRADADETPSIAAQLQEVEADDELICDDPPDDDLIMAAEDVKKIANLMVSELSFHHRRATLMVGKTTDSERFIIASFSRRVVRVAGCLKETQFRV